MISHRIINHYRKGKSNFQNLYDAFGTVHDFVLNRQGFVKREKPLEVLRRFIVHYTKPDEVILDLFGGSGSTLMAAEVSQRYCYTIEKDPRIVDHILKRFEDFTKIKTKKLDT